jgi:hypothetical protein
MKKFLAHRPVNIFYTLDFKVTIYTQLDEVFVKIQDMIDPLKRDLAKSVFDLSEQVNPLITQAQDLEKTTQVYRLFPILIFGFPIIMSIVGVVSYSPRIVKGYIYSIYFRSNCLCIPLYILVNIMALLFLLSSFFVGDGFYKCNCSMHGCI